MQPPTFSVPLPLRKEVQSALSKGKTLLIEAKIDPGDPKYVVTVKIVLIKYDGRARFFVNEPTFGLVTRRTDRWLLTEPSEDRWRGIENEIECIAMSAASKSRRPFRSTAVAYSKGDTYKKVSPRELNDDQFSLCFE